jgi:Tol biopolymer transport system component
MRGVEGPPVAARVRARIVGGVAMASLLSGCILGFPPFWIPEDPGMPGDQIVVENGTHDDWVLVLESSFPTSFAIAAGETGTVLPWDGVPDELALLDPDCTEVDRMEWEGVGAVAIEDPGSLSTSDAPDNAADLDPFIEFYGCEGLGSFGSPEPGTALPGADAASGTIMLIGGDNLPYRYDPAANSIQPVFAESPAAIWDDEYAWSPDATRVAFSRVDEMAGSLSVYVADADGSGAEMLVDDASSPRWSPDGTTVAYINADPFARSPELWTVDVETGKRTELAADAATASWSPDGSLLAYVTSAPFDFEDEPPPSELRIVGADGSGARSLTEAAPFVLAPPAWSPDGSRLAFAALPDGEETSIFGGDTLIAVYDLEDRGVTEVAAVDGAMLDEPAWSPNGDTIAFTISQVGFLNATGAVGVVPSAGGEVIRLGEADGAYVTDPTWSPDGAWLLVARSAEFSFEADAVALDPDGDEEIVLASGIYSIGAWLAEGGT